MSSKIITYCTFILLLLISCHSYQESLSEQSNVLKGGQASYQQYCASCHGPHLQKFKNEDWKKGKTPTEIQKIIRMGMSEQGMPAFGEALSDEAIADVTSYILQYEFDTLANSPVLSASYPIEVIVEGLDIPWGMEFLPNGEMLIAEREGKLSKLTNSFQ